MKDAMSMPEKCLAETYERGVGVRCISDATQYGYCYYHHKMVEGFIVPSKEVEKVTSIAGFTIYTRGQKVKK